jgi:hypothetical protein
VNASGGVYNALGQIIPDLTTITQLGTLTSLKVEGDLVVDGGTLSVSNTTVRILLSSSSSSSKTTFPIESLAGGKRGLHEHRRWI